jgi:DNA polymerase-3 subunit delta
MTSISTSRVASYVARPDPKARAFLLYGTDTGLIREHGAALCKALAAAAGGSPEVIRLTEDDLDREPDRLAIEVRTVSMFSPHKVIRARVSGRLTTELAQFAWGDVPDNTWVVIEAGNLKKDAKLRRVFENGQSLSALPCHDSDNPASTVQLVRRELREAGIGIDSDAESQLASMLSGDPGVAKSEIAKLVTFAQGAERLSVEDVEAVVGDTSRATLDASVDAVLSRDVPAALRLMARLQAEGIPVDVLLHALGQHLLRLIRLRARMDAGVNAETALRSLRPPVHFRRADNMKLQIRTWGRNDLRRALDLASRAHQRARLEPQLDEQIATDLVIRLARSGNYRPGHR